MSTPNNPDRLSVFPDGIIIDDYANADIMDMKIFKHVMEQRDEVIIRALRRGQDKANIARMMGIGRTTVWRVVDRYYRNGGE